MIQLIAWQRMRLVSPLLEYAAGRLSFATAMRGAQLILRSQGIGSGDEVISSGETKVFDLVSSSAPVLFDVGGHVGEYSRAFLRRFRQGKVFLFEPSATHMALAKRDLAERVHFYDVALSDREGTAVLYKHAEVSGMASLTRRDLDYRNVQMNLTETVRCRTLDSIVADQGVDRIDLLKIDVEGHELDVLNGARKALTDGKVRLVQFEFGGCNIDTRTPLREFFRFFKPLGYSLYLVRPRGRPAPLADYHEFYEQYQTSNYLAVKSNSDP